MNYSFDYYLNYLEKQISIGINEYSKIKTGDNKSMQFTGPFALYNEKFEKIEFFARLTYGIVVSTKCGNEVGLDFFNDQLLNCTDAKHISYWGNIVAPDQRLVELVPILLMLYVNKAKIWDTYNDLQKRQISGWIAQINNIRIKKTNWIYFYSTFP